jgi:hypothetical protein
MLDRVPAPPDRARARRRQQRYRERLKAGLISISLDVDSKVVDWLMRTKWLCKRDYHSRAEIAAAVAALLADSAAQG